MLIKRTLSVTVLMLLFAYTVRVYKLGDKAVWWDEAWSVVTAQQSFAQTTEITARDVHPALYQWALHGWVRVAGISEFAVRYLSLLFGFIAVAVVYPLTLRLAGRNRSGQRAAGLAMFFVALSTLHIHWSQETRMYAMASAAAILACYAYLRGSDRWSAWWGLLIVAGAATALTHYLGAFMLVILNLHWLLTVRSRSQAFNLRWIGAMIVTGLIVGVWMVYAVTRIRSGGAEAGAQPGFIFQLGATLLAVGTSVNVERYTWPALLASIGLLSGLALYTRQHWRNGLLLLLVTLFPLLAIFLLSFPNRFYNPRPEERYLAIFAPLVIAGVGLALERLQQVWPPLGIAATAGLFGLYSYSYLQATDARYLRDDYAMMLRTVTLLAKPDEPIFFVSGDRYPLVLYHLNRASNAGTAESAQTTLRAQEISRLDGVDVASDLVRISQIIGTNNRFWLVEIEKSLGDPHNVAIPYLDEHYYRVLHIPIDYNGITLYSKVDTANNKHIPDSSQILPPVIHEARPGDIVRIGVPAGTQATLMNGSTVVSAQSSLDSWFLAQFPVSRAYPPGTYWIRAGDHVYPLTITHTLPTPVPSVNLNAPFGILKLIGYAVPSKRIKAGEVLEITLYWQATDRSPVNYTAFVHLIGPFNPATNGPLWVGSDSYPADTPTSQWWNGLLAADKRVLQIPADAPVGAYSVELGLYQLETGQRLNRQDNGENAVLVPGFEVIK